MKLCGMIEFKLLVLTFLFLSWLTIALAQEEPVNVFPVCEDPVEDDENSVEKVQQQIEMIMNDLLNFPNKIVLQDDNCSDKKARREEVCFDVDYDHCPARDDVTRNRPEASNCSLLSAPESYKSVQISGNSSRISGRLPIINSNLSNLRKPQNLTVVSSEVRNGRGGEAYGRLTVYNRNSFDPKAYEIRSDNSTETHDQVSRDIQRGLFFNDCVLSEIIPEKFSKLTGIRKLFPSTDNKTNGSDGVVASRGSELSDDHHSNSNRSKRACVVADAKTYLQPIYDALNSLQGTLYTGRGSQDETVTTNDIMERMVSQIKRDLKYILETIEQEISRFDPVREDGDDT